MAIPERTVTITGVFAESASTSIPTPPASGVSYRDTGMTKEEINNGWPYKKIVDSSQFNQALFEYSTLSSLQEKYGFVPWSNLTDYAEGSYCLGTDGTIYRALQATGPSSTAYNPVDDTSHTYWIDVFNGSDMYIRTSKFQVVKSLPASPASDTFYFVTGA